MAIKQVMAFQISDGRCFADRSQANQEELNQLRQSLEVIKQKGNSVETMDRLVAEISAWLERAKELQSQILPNKPENT